MKLIVNADDFGICVGITDRIITAFHRGYLNRVSIIPNGYAFDYAVSKLGEINGLPCAVHLNLIEGEPVSNPETIPLLTDKKGYFRRSFLTLWIIYLFAVSKRKELLDQIASEIESQINRVRQALPLQQIVIDSHQHVHLLPFIFRVLMDRAERWGIDAVRIINEPFIFMKTERGGEGSPNFLNTVKHILLNQLSKRCRTIMKRCRVSCLDYSSGVLFSGKMSLEVVRRTIAKIEHRDKRSGLTMEFIFHPGPADTTDLPVWNETPRYRSFYFSPDRAAEMEVLLSDNFREYILRKQGGTNG
jgi:predicted glycoside hydrolase/deacetylase ChbG (UPF0249 family)